MFTRFSYRTYGTCLGYLWKRFVKKQPLRLYAYRILVKGVFKNEVVACYVCPTPENGLTEPLCVKFGTDEVIFDCATRIISLPIPYKFEEEDFSNER